MKKIIYFILAFTTCFLFCFSAQQEPTEKVLCYQKLDSKNQWIPLGFYNRTYMEYDLAILKSALEQDLVFAFDGNYKKISTILNDCYVNSTTYRGFVPPSDRENNKILQVYAVFYPTLLPEIFMVQLIRRIRLFELIELDYYPDLCVFFNKATKSLSLGYLSFHPLVYDSYKVSYQEISISMINLVDQEEKRSVKKYAKKLRESVSFNEYPDKNVVDFVKRLRAKNRLK